MAELSFEDPCEQLDLTQFAQPALLTHHIACFEVFKELCDESFVPLVVAGHSLGEYTALAVAESLRFEDALRLVEKRGQLMGAHGEGGMLALPIDQSSARRLAEKHCCEIASLNLPEQTVIGGTDEDLEALAGEAAELYPRKASVRLRTEGAFHTYLMITAARFFKPVLDSIEMRPPTISVLSNYTGKSHDANVMAIRSMLFFQLFKSVDWIGCMQTAIEHGVMTFVEFGGGIGRSPHPASKRPNLESIIRKDCSYFGHHALYLPAINSHTIKKAAHFFSSARKLSKVTTHPHPSGFGIQGTAVDENRFHLVIPTHDGVISQNSVEPIARVDELDLGSVVQLIEQASDENVECVKFFFGEDTAAPQPYLEKVVGCETGAILHYIDKDIETELVQLAQRVTAQDDKRQGTG
jgi:[acyl-carrier-protein] S-malonyltransferase